MENHLEAYETIRQKVVGVLGRIGNGWIDWNEKAQREKMDFSDYITPEVFCTGDWWRNKIDGVEHARVKLAREVMEADAVKRQDLGEITTEYGFLSSNYSDYDKTKPQTVVDDNIEITVTSPTWQRDTGTATEFEAEKMRVRHAQDETALFVVNQICDALAASQQQTATKKLSKLNLAAKAADLVQTGKTNTDSGREM